MATKEKKSKRQRREEIMARVNRERQNQGQPAGPELTGPHGVGAPRATGSDVPARGSATPQQAAPDKRLPE